MTRWGLAVALACSLLAFSCTGEDNIAGALRGNNTIGEGEQVPFFLSQNYPEPFNPSTTIGFSIPLPSPLHVKLSVFTEDWQPVTTVLDEAFVPRYYRVEYDAGNLPSGLYYYVMEGGGVTQIRSMRLMK